jgi:hypothetical protein
MEGSGRGLILRYYTGIRLEGLWKTTKHQRISGFRAEILTSDLSSTKQKC